MAAGWSADETQALLGIWGDADVQSKPHESSGPLPLSPLPRAFPSPSTISARLSHEQIEQQEYHERIALPQLPFTRGFSSLSSSRLHVVWTRSMRLNAHSANADSMRICFWRSVDRPLVFSSLVFCYSLG